MAQTRASLGFAEALEAIDLATFATKPKAKPSEPGEVAVAARAAGFRSREGDAPPPASDQMAPLNTTAQQRRRRTGRTAQINLKAKPETIALYCALADRMGWGLAETFEKAVTLLQERYGDGS